MKRLNLNLATEDYESLKVVAEEKNTNITAIIRELVVEHLPSLREASKKNNKLLLRVIPNDVIPILIKVPKNLIDSSEELSQWLAARFEAIKNQFKK